MQVKIFIRSLYARMEEKKVWDTLNYHTRHANSRYWYPPLCKRHFTPHYNATVDIPRGQTSFSRLLMIIISPHTFPILAFYNDWWPMIYSFKRSCHSALAKLAMHSQHSRTQRGPNFSTKLFWDIIHAHISNVHAFGGNRFTGERFSVRAHLHTNSMWSLRKTNYAEYVPFWSKKFINTCSHTNIHMNTLFDGFWYFDLVIWWCYHWKTTQNGQKTAI